MAQSKLQVYLYDAAPVSVQNSVCCGIEIIWNMISNLRWRSDIWLWKEFCIFSSRQLVILLQREPQGLKSLDRKVSEPWEDEALKAKEEDD